MIETENRKPERKRWLFSIACLLALLTVGGSLALIRTRGQKSQDAAPTSREGRPNRLINEKSPYLLQHAHNPVDWYPWGEDAFEKARKENEPIFLSIGYSTCHWCHVMESESFSDSQVASLMNDAFVSIKVDREERPDIDNVYMNVSMLMTGSGGWPLTIIMTPDKRPFFVATYIPKDNRFGQAGLMELIPRVKEAWATQHERILQSATQIWRPRNGGSVIHRAPSIIRSKMASARQPLRSGGAIPVHCGSEARNSENVCVKCG
jgi:uncharacterized protein YyaL (SSP411 family)